MKKRIRNKKKRSTFRSKKSVAGSNKARLRSELRDPNAMPNSSKVGAGNHYSKRGGNMAAIRSKTSGHRQK